ncbi:MAG: hypothetical protein U1F11_14755 [Steroidobacteraceae bacterium]
MRARSHIPERSLRRAPACAARALAWLALACAAAGAWLAAPAASAAGIETLLMPGKVSSAHAKYETECSLCHDRADRERQPALCLDCHKDTAADLAAKSGLHGRMANAASSQCKSCHSEHLGREGDIVKFDRASFDHRATDFALEGAHRGLACESCHEKGKPLRKAASSCGACHKKDDAHRGQLGEKCSDCHTTLAWSGGKFDHAKTDFKLENAHREVACNACHVGGRYKDTPQRCASCHTPDDVHQNSRGDKCGECHTTESWKSAKFDHGKETGFALLGRHSSLQCGNCHKAGDFKDKPPKECVGCHRADDAHALRFGEQCKDCHGNDAWKQQQPYDHLAKHKFALTGAHEKLDCHACHTAVAKTQKLGNTCEACHRAADPHGGKLGLDCAACHGSDDWKRDIRFDHDLTSYPLLGLHLMVGCAQCHASKAFKGVAKDCIGCHRQDDVHKGGLGKDCTACHSPNGWKLWDFDHAEQAKFPLNGAHAKLKCNDCHRQPAGEVKLGRDCAACHRKDDVHLGQYGTQCQRCHTVITFKGARIQ